LLHGTRRGPGRPRERMLRACVDHGSCGRYRPVAAGVACAEARGPRPEVRGPGLRTHL
jgi:hypothetical protein